MTDISSLRIAKHIAMQDLLAWESGDSFDLPPIDISPVEEELAASFACSAWVAYSTETFRHLYLTMNEDVLRQHLRLVEVVPFGMPFAGPNLQESRSLLERPPAGWHSPVPGKTVVVERKAFDAILDRLSALELAVCSRVADDHSQTNSTSTSEKVSIRIGACFYEIGRLARELFGEDAVAEIVSDSSAESGWRIAVCAPPGLSEFRERRREWFRRIVKDFPELLPGDVSLDVRQAG